MEVCASPVGAEKAEGEGAWPGEQGSSQNERQGQIFGVGGGWGVLA